MSLPLTMSELNGLARVAIGRLTRDRPSLGAVVLTWNRGKDKTPVAMFTHVSAEERRALVGILRSMADQAEATETTYGNGLIIRPT